MTATPPTRLRVPSRQFRVRHSITTIGVGTFKGVIVWRFCMRSSGGTPLRKHARDATGRVPLSCGRGDPQAARPCRRRNAAARSRPHCRQRHRSSLRSIRRLSGVSGCPWPQSLGISSRPILRRSLLGKWTTTVLSRSLQRPTIRSKGDGQNAGIPGTLRRGLLVIASPEAGNHAAAPRLRYRWSSVGRLSVDVDPQ